MYDATVPRTKRPPVADGLFPLPALSRKPTRKTGRARLSPPEEVGRVAAARSKALPLRTPGETAMLEAFDLAHAYPGELAHILAGVRAGLHAAGRTRPVGRGTA
jgi:hypothetical protein